MMHSFLPPYSKAAVGDMRRRLRQTRWPQIVFGAGSNRGVNRGFLQDLCGYLVEIIRVLPDAIKGRTADPTLVTFGERTHANSRKARTLVRDS